MDIVTAGMQDRVKQLLDQNDVTFDAASHKANPRRYYPLGDGAPAYTLDEIVQDLWAIRVQRKDVRDVIVARYRAYRGDGVQAPGQFHRVLIQAILTQDPNIYPVALKHDVRAVLAPNEFIAALDGIGFMKLYDRCIKTLGIDAGHKPEYVTLECGTDNGRGMCFTIPDQNDALQVCAGEEPDNSDAGFGVPTSALHSISHKERRAERGRQQSTYQQIEEHLAYEKALKLLRALSEPSNQNQLRAIRVQVAQAGCWKLDFFRPLDQADRALDALCRNDGRFGANAANVLVKCLADHGFSPETARLQAGSAMYLLQNLCCSELYDLVTPVRENREGCHRLCNWIDPEHFAYLWGDSSVTEESLREAGWHLADKWAKLMNQFEPRDAA